MKKILTLIVLLFGLVLVTGCLPSQDDPPNLDDFDAKINIDTNTQANLRILIPGGNLNETTMIESAIEGFNLIYPNINISLSYVSVNAYENTVRNQAAAGVLPDIIWTNTPDILFLIDKNLALPLNQYFELSEEADVFNLEETFHKEFIDMVTVNGNIYAIPRSADSVVTFYNKKLLSEAGVDLTRIQNGWTWETFLDIAREMRTYYDANGMNERYIIDANLTTWLSVNYPMLRSFGADVADAEGNIILDSPETIATLEAVRTLVTERLSVATGMTAGSSFEVGTSPFLFQSAAISLFAERRELKNNIDIVSFPLIGDSPKIGSGVAGYSINANTQYKDESWAFLNYLLSFEGQERMAEGGLKLPSIRKDLADFTTAEWGKGYENLNLGAYLYGPQYKLSIEFLNYFDPKYKPDLDLAIRDLFNNASNPDRTIRDALDIALRDIDDALSN
ncbi:MAG: extracellular solute-binding protein [Acholeplasmataceae bacterium]|nr:extracellular solute-binding protein [Acholeplasmataceae bacterium]